MPKKTEQMVHMRMPMALHRRLSREAKLNSQTLSSEIMRRLEMSLRFDAVPDAGQEANFTPEKYFALAQEALHKHMALFHEAVRLDTLRKIEGATETKPETTGEDNDGQR